MSETNSGWDIWCQAAEIMSNVDEEATFWDLARAMYRYFNNRDMPIEEPNDYDLVYYHQEGRSPEGISWAMDLSPEAIRDYLESMGFKPWKEDLECRTYDIIYDHETGVSIGGLSRMHEVSRYVVEKIIREFDHAKITRF